MRRDLLLALLAASAGSGVAFANITVPTPDDWKLSGIQKPEGFAWPEDWTTGFVNVVNPAGGNITSSLDIPTAGKYIFKYSGDNVKVRLSGNITVTEDKHSATSGNHQISFTTTGPANVVIEVYAKDGINGFTFGKVAISLDFDQDAAYAALTAELARVATPVTLDELYEASASVLGETYAELKEKFDGFEATKQGIVDNIAKLTSALTFDEYGNLKLVDYPDGDVISTAIAQYKAAIDDYNQQAVTYNRSNQRINTNTGIANQRLANLNGADNDLNELVPKVEAMEEGEKKTDFLARIDECNNLRNEYVTKVDAINKDQGTRYLTELQALDGIAQDYINSVNSLVSDFAATQSNNENWEKIWGDINGLAKVKLPYTYIRVTSDFMNLREGDYRREQLRKAETIYVEALANVKILQNKSNIDSASALVQNDITTINDACTELLNLMDEVRDHVYQVEMAVQDANLQIGGLRRQLNALSTYYCGPDAKKTELDDWKNKILGDINTLQTDVNNKGLAYEIPDYAGTVESIREDIANLSSAIMEAERVKAAYVSNKNYIDGLRRRLENAKGDIRYEQNNSGYDIVGKLAGAYANIDAAIGVLETANETEYNRNRIYTIPPTDIVSGINTYREQGVALAIRFKKLSDTYRAQLNYIDSYDGFVETWRRKALDGNSPVADDISNLRQKVDAYKARIDAAYALENAEEMQEAVNRIETDFSIQTGVEQAKTNYMFAVTDGNRKVVLGLWQTLRDQLDGNDENVVYDAEAIGQEHWDNINGLMTAIWEQIKGERGTDPQGTLTQDILDLKNSFPYKYSENGFQGYVNQINNLKSDIEKYRSNCEIYKTNETNYKDLAGKYAISQTSLAELFAWIEENTMEGATTTYNNQARGINSDLTELIRNINNVYNNVLSNNFQKGITDILHNYYEEKIDAINGRISALKEHAEANERSLTALLQKSSDTLAAINSALAELPTVDGDLYDTDQAEKDLNALKDQLPPINKDVYDFYSKATLNDTDTESASEQTNTESLMNNYQSILDQVSDILSKVHSDYWNAVNDANNQAFEDYWTPLYTRMTEKYDADFADYNEFATCTTDENEYHEALLEEIVGFKSQIEAYNYEAPAEGAESGKIFALNEEVKAMLREALPKLEPEEWDVDKIEVLTKDDFRNFQSMGETYISELGAIDTEMKNAANTFAEGYFNNIYTDAREKVDQAKIDMDAAMTDKTIAEPIISAAIEPYNEQLKTANDIKKGAENLSLKMDAILEALDGITAENIKIRTEAAGNSYWVIVYDNTIAEMEQMIEGIRELKGIDTDPYVNAIEQYKLDAGVLNYEEGDNYARLECLSNLKALCSRLDAIVTDARAKETEAQNAAQAAIDNADFLLETINNINGLQKDWSELCNWTGALGLSDEEMNGLGLSGIFDGIVSFMEYVGMHDADALANADQYNQRIESIKAQISAAYAAAFTAEKNMLIDRLSDVVDNFNILKSQGYDQDKLKDWNDKIDELAETFDTLVAPSSAEGYNDALKAELVGYERDIDTLGKEISEAAGKEWTDFESSAAAALQILQDQYDKLNGEVVALTQKINDCGFDTVKTEFLGNVEALGKRLGEQPARWKAAGNTIVATYQDYAGEMTKINIALDNLTTQVDDAIAEAQALKEKQEASQAAYDRLSAELDALQTSLDNARTTIEGYELTGESFNKDLLDQAQSMIDSARERIRTENESANLTEDSTIETAGTIQLAINVALGDATTAETTAQIAAAREAVNTAADFIIGGAFTNEAELRAALAQLQTRLAALKATDNAEEAPAVIESAKTLKGDAEQLLEDAAEGKLVIGDLDGNGSLSVSDVVALINMIISGEADGNKIADVNGDGHSNAADISALINLIVNGDAVKTRILSKAPAIQGANTLNVVCMGEENGVRHLAVLVNNSAVFVNGQMDITLPEGMRIVGETIGERASALDLYSGDLDNGKHRVLLASLAFNDITGTDGAVLYLDVEGEGDITVDNVVFSDRRGRAYNVQSNANGLSGIQNIGESESFGQKIYNLGGMMLDKLRKGINIIRKSDGSSEKVIKK